MFKGFLVGFILVVLLIALLLYVYGKNVLTNIASPKTDAYVESTLVPSHDTWIQYTPLSKKFDSKFPATPQHATDRLIDEKTKELKQYEMFISESNGKVFMISVISFLNDDKVKDEETTLKNIIDDMVAAKSGNKLEKIQYGMYEGHKDAEFLITNNAYALTGIAFIDKNQLYVLTSLSSSPKESKNEFDYFVKSFKLNSNEPSNIAPFPIEK